MNKIDLQGNVLETLSVDFAFQPEGLFFDGSGALWVMSEPDTLFRLEAPAPSCEDFDAVDTVDCPCKAANACSECSDIYFGDDCTSDEREHCAEIECCPACEAEIQVKWRYKHGGVCRGGLLAGSGCIDVV